MTVNLLQPKNQCNFIVKFKNFGYGTTHATNLVLTQQIISCSRPKCNFAAKEVGDKIWPVDPTWEPLEMVIRDDITNKTIDAVLYQIKNQKTNNVKFDLSVDSMYDNTTVEHWVYEKCSISSCDFGKFNYSKSIALEIMLHICFENAFVELNSKYTGNNMYDLK